MLQAEFNTLTRDDLEKLKFVLDTNWDVAIRILWGVWGSWDVVWPGVAVNNNVATFDTTTGKLIKDSWFSIATSVPGWAVFTDTTYNVWNWGLTEINFTTALNTLLGTAEQAVNKNSVNWYAGLDAWGKINPLQLPALAISETFVVASEIAQLALTVQEWDIAIRTDESQSYIALNDTNSTMADWQVLLTPTDLVSSVAWKTGIVTLDNADVWLGNVDNTSDANKPVSTAQQTALDLKTNNTISVTSIAWTPTWWDRVATIISLTQAEYDSASKVGDTFYLITNA